RRVDADTSFPLGRDLCQIVRPDVGRARCFGTVDNHDVDPWETQPGIEPGDRLVVPPRDGAQENVRQHRTGELEVRRDPGHVVDRHNTAEDGGDVEDFAGG